MQRVIVDQVLRERLGDFSQPIELCDSSGRVLGHIIPAVYLAKFQPWKPEFTEEELREAEQSTTWYSTDELLAHLRSLEK